MNTIKYFDMFAGIGGFRTGLRNVGDFFMPVGWCEIDKKTQRAYRALYETEGEYFCDDARAINTEELPDIDLICGGFPCQPYAEKKNIPKKVKRLSKNNNQSQKLRDKILDSGHFKPVNFLIISSSFFHIASDTVCENSQFAFSIASRFMAVSA